MRKILTIFLVVCLLATCTCAMAEDKPYEGESIRVLLANHMWTSAITPYLDEFTALTGIQVNVEEYAEDQLSQKLAIELASMSSDLDVFMTRPLQEIKQFIKNGWLYDISELIADPSMQADDYIPSALEIYKSGDGVFGVPLITERQILYYRADLFEAAGLAVPTTFAELEACAAALTDRDNNQYGIVSRGLTAAAVTQFSGYLRGFGGDFLDADGNASIATPEAIEALTYYGDLLRNYGPPGVESMHWQQCAAVYSQGNIAMYTDADSLFNNVVNAEDSKVVDVTGYAVMPGGAPYNVTSWGLSIGAFTQKAGAASEFIKWAAGHDMVFTTQRNGVPGARASVWDDPEANVSFPPQMIEVIQASNKIGVSSDRPLIIKVGEARDAIGLAIVTAIDGGDVEAAAKTANEQFQAIIERERNE